LNNNLSKITIAVVVRKEEDKVTKEINFNPFYWLNNQEIKCNNIIHMRLILHKVLKIKRLEL